MSFAKYGLVWWSGCNAWHFPIEEPSRRGDRTECDNTIPQVGAVSWSTESGAKVKLMDICQGCITRRAERFAANEARKRLRLENANG